MTQLTHKLHVIIDKHAEKELNKLSKVIQYKFKSAFELLEESGYLKEPFAKKLASQHNLFEIRIKYLGQWRSVYSYFKNNYVVILSVFQKKTQKTPLSELQKAKKRLKNYE